MRRLHEARYSAFQLESFEAWTSGRPTPRRMATATTVCTSLITTGKRKAGQATRFCRLRLLKVDPAHHVPAIAGEEQPQPPRRRQATTTRVVRDTEKSRRV